MARCCLNLRHRFLLAAKTNLPDAHRRKVMERAELELSLLNEISRVLGRRWTCTAYRSDHAVLAERLGMERGSLVLRDEMTGKLHTETAVRTYAGRDPPRHLRNRRGNHCSVVAKGEAIVVRDIASDERFLNRTGRGT